MTITMKRKLDVPKTTHLGQIKLAERKYTEKSVREVWFAIGWETQTALMSMTRNETPPVWSLYL